MAHLEKLTKGALNGIIMHVERKVKNHSNKEIDITKSGLNYALLGDGFNANERLKKRSMKSIC